ncbi:TIGR03086 family metal-binding protein [Actinokineospora soli]|uniref:TIGR03086 family metal-binding protein n=1 Tax=Actinokineospora soli TaxID=1048753 RepID=A0ABW2TKF7_9PSEU
MDHKLMARAAEATIGVARTVTPEQYGLPTPCPEWDVRALINHVTHWSAVVSERTARKLPPPADGSEDEGTDYTGGDWPAFFAERVERSVAAWGEPGAWEGETVMAASPMPAQTIGSMLFCDLVMHGWDLAVSTGQTYTVPDEVGEAALRVMEEIAEMGRQWGAFGPEVAVPADAPALDRALAMSGRDPAWRP